MKYTSELTIDLPRRRVMENDFKFSGLMVLMGIFMRGAFPKQTIKDMTRFKEFAEGSS